MPAAEPAAPQHRADAMPFVGMWVCAAPRSSRARARDQAERETAKQPAAGRLTSTGAMVEEEAEALTDPLDTLNLLKMAISDLQASVDTVKEHHATLVEPHVGTPAAVAGGVQPPEEQESELVEPGPTARTLSGLVTARPNATSVTEDIGRLSQRLEREIKTTQRRLVRGFGMARVLLLYLLTQVTQVDRMGAVEREIGSATQAATFGGPWSPAPQRATAEGGAQGFSDSDDADTTDSDEEQHADSARRETAKLKAATSLQRIYDKLQPTVHQRTVWVGCIPVRVPVSTCPRNC
jgi:hypothetical protein